jgi:hypothetical protein
MAKNIKVAQHSVDGAANDRSGSSMMLFAGCYHPRCDRSLSRKAIMPLTASG